MLCLIYVASWPGAVVRPLVVELMAAPLPENLADRDGVLDVIVKARGGDESPVSSARVRAFAMIDGRAHAAGEAKTDDQGRATLRELPHTEHWIVAEAPGRARASQMVVVVSGARRVDLELGVEHTLEVVVKNEQGAAVANAELEIRGGDPFPVGARTDDQGRAHVGRLGEGPFVVTARATGFEEIVQRRVPEGRTCNITLSRQGALMVTVVDEVGKRVQGARVLIASPSLWPARVAETSADGTVRIGGLDTGSYSLRAVQGARVSPIEVGVSVGKGDERAVELKLGPGVMIAAKVVDALEDDGIPKAKVTLAESGLSPFPIEGLTDKNGLVTLGPIAPGPSTLSVFAEGYVSRPATRIEEVPPSEVKISLVRGGALVGRIVDARGYPVDGATIRIVGTDLEGMPIDEEPHRTSFREAHFTAALAGPRPLIPSGELGVMPGPVPGIPRAGTSIVATSPSLVAAPATADVEPWISGRDGTFEARPIPPGRVRALVRHPQYVEAMSEVVTLVSDHDARVPDIVLARGGTLEGRVVDPRGKPVAGAHVTVLATRGSLERVTRTGTDGSFGFASVPEALTVLVSRDEDVSQVAARAEISVPDGGRKTMEIVLPEAREPLAVHVSGDRGSPVGNAQVSAISLDPGEGLRVTAFTDAHGEASLASARGLALRVEVHAPGRSPKVVMTTPETTKLDVELTVAESVTGEVWANRRETIEGAEITLQTETGTRHARTDKDGVFTIAEAPPGRAKLRIRAKGRAPLVRDVTIEDRGGRRATDLGKMELAEEGVVEGTVIDTRGDPVPGARVSKDTVPTYLPASAGGLSGIAVCDSKGHFRLGELPEGSVVLEAYAPDVGRAHLSGIRVVSGRTTDRVKFTLSRDASPSGEPLATGGVAVTLGETAAGLEGPEVVIVAVADGSEAERAGLAPNDLVVEIGGLHPTSIVDARARLSGPVHDDVLVKVRRGERSLTFRIAREPVRR